MRRGFCRWGIALLAATLPQFARCEEAAGSFLDQLRGRPAAAISGNPAAENNLPGNAWLIGLIPGKPLDTIGLRLGGVWLADTNGLISGGAQPGKWSWNSALIVGADVDAEKLVGWKGASFGIQFLQFNGENTNAQAGSVQGYNSLPGPPPLDRSELYQLWYRQSLWDDRIVFRIGKVVPTFDFNNVARPVPTQNQELSIPAVTGLLYTPVFVNPTLLGAIGGYYNSVCGLTVTLAPTRNTYLSYGFYDGNVIQGVQTGMTGPHFNGYYFNIWEAGLAWVIADKYPGQFGAGLWYQSGLVQRPNASQDGMGGFYMFGSQRIWSAAAGDRSARQGKEMVAAPKHQRASISTFAQFGVNNAEVLPVNQYFGLGLTGFGLIPGRAADSLGAGISWAWLNPKAFDRPSELMFQGYYQAHLVAGAFFQPAVTYIPTPGANASLGGAWAITFRLTLLF
ncbi:MAG TPA: carbohydrate porin [Terrimicrobiaceae bacterium]